MLPLWLAWPASRGVRAMHGRSGDEQCAQMAEIGTPLCNARDVMPRARPSSISLRCRRHARTVWQREGGEHQAPKRDRWYVVVSFSERRATPPANGPNAPMPSEVAPKITQRHRAEDSPGHKMHKGKHTHTTTPRPTHITYVAEVWVSVFGCAAFLCRCSGPHG